MKKRLMSIIICALLSIGAFPVLAAAEGGNNTGVNDVTKTATLNEDETSVLIDIETQYTVPEKVLVYQGTYCKAHDLKDDVIVNALNSLLGVADVDYYAETVHYSSGAHKKDEIKHFKKGTTVSTNDIYKTVSTNGNHIVSQECLDHLMETLEKEDYAYLIMIVDGGFATGLSGGTSGAILNVKKSLMLTDEQYVDRMHYAQTLSKMPIVYLMSPLNAADSSVSWDGGGSTSANATTYEKAKAYWADSNLSSTSGNAALYYLDAHLYIEGLAFLCPDYYLSIIDTTTGKVKLSTPPAAKNIPYDTDRIVFYDNAAAVSSKMTAVKRHLTPTKITIKDALAVGLQFKSGKIQYCENNDSNWKDIDPEAVSITTEGQTVIATIHDVATKYKGMKFRLNIAATPSDDFGFSGDAVETNGECTVEYSNEDDDVINEQEAESPTVTFTTFNVYYKEGDHGTLTGIAEETFKKATGGVTSGSGVEADEHYIHTGWICDKDVTLTDGTRFAVGTLLSDDQIGMVSAKEEMTFTAQYEPVRLLVEYVVEEDADYGKPDDSITPNTKEYYYNDEVIIEPGLTTEQATAVHQTSGESVSGSWAFVPWDHEDFQITEDTVITGKWVFTPTPVPGDDIPPDDDQNPEPIIPDDDRNPEPIIPGGDDHDNADVTPPTNSGDNSTTGDLPSTGDGDGLAVWINLFVLSGLLFALTVVYAYKKREDR